KTFRGKKAVLLSVAGDNDDSCFESIKSSFKGCCNYADWSIAGIICAPAMYPKTDMADKGRKFLFEAYDLGKNL
ncbi:MAG: flavodoxin family protein, partial [Cloacibacillus sp.]